MIRTVLNKRKEPMIYMKLKKLATLMLASGFLVACGQKQTPENTEPNEPVEEVQVKENEDMSDVVEEETTEEEKETVEEVEETTEDEKTNDEKQ